MTDDINRVDGIPLRSDEIGFSPDEMILCAKCAKSNPPNRLQCFYCGDGLQLPEALAAGIQFRPKPLEGWELGVNLIAVDGLNEIDPSALVSTLSLSPEFAERMLNVDCPLPLFRVPADEANEVQSRLERAGLTIERVDDTDLSLSKPPARIRALTFQPDSIVFHRFNSNESTTVETADVRLVLIGSIVTTRSESKLKKTRKENREFDEHLMETDHSVIDIYAEGHELGFRIVPHGFDFSCLGESKSLLAAENVRKLCDKLKATLADAVIDGSYSRKSALLDQVWPRTVANTSKGIQRNWFGVQRSTGTATSNEEQFTRYSRVRRELL